MKKGILIYYIGIVVTAVSIVWWFMTFGLNLDLIHCLYSEGVQCSIGKGVAEVKGGMAYNHFLFLGGFALIVVGAVLRVL